MSGPIRLLLTALALVLFASRTGAASLPTVLLDAEHPRPSLDGAVSYLADPGAQLTIEQAISPARAAEYQQVRGAELSAGFRIGDALWIHYRIARADPDAPKHWWIHAGHGFTDEIELYVLDQDRVADARQGGRALPFARKEVAWSGQAFRLILDDTRPRDIYLRYQSTNTLRIPLQVFENRRFEEYRATENLAQGAFFGIMALFVLAALFRAIRLRSRVDASYATYLFAVETNNLIVFGWFQQLGLSDSLQELHLIGAGAIVLAALALGDFMRLFITWPGQFQASFDRWLYNLGALYVLSVLLTGIVAQHHLAKAASAASLLIAILVTVVAVRAAYFRLPNARYFLAAFSPFLLVILARLLQVFGMVSLTHDIQHMVMLATLFHAVLLFAAILLRDDSERRERAQLDWEVSQLKNTIQNQSLFMRMLAHEVRTPLAIIDGQTQVMAGAMRAGKSVQPHVVAIREGIRRLSLILERFVTQDRLATASGFRFSSVDMQRIAQRVASESQRRTEKHLIRLECGPCPGIQGDEALLEVMLANLVDNAINYSPDGGSILIRISVVENASLSIEVTDEGIGIPRDMLEKIFDRYVRTEQVADAVGAGLGLYIVRKIASLHRGHVECRSEPGQGSTFLVSLPLA